ncbi:TauD/TfdA family dioxygenase [Streptomyces sp. SID4917]|nr:TauD/TfdA family dioxygenase [Streptomyces sp. SID4917]MYZ39376.1 TauD/TfdA family dioxygenase [Streptomyces sp. SID4917]
MTVHPVAGYVGAEIRNVDLAGELDPDTVQHIRAALLRHRVVFFRGQSLDAAGHERFGRRFGDLTAGHPMMGAEEAAHGNRAVLDLDYGREAVKSDAWHTDVTFVHRPPFGSILRALTIPPYGGDTLWADTVRAYATLPAGLRQLADGLWAVHAPVSKSYDTPDMIVTPDVLSLPGACVTRHPVVRVHPETGEHALLLGSSVRSFSGWSEADSRDLLRIFQNYVTRPENTVRWRWAAGDVAFWDNRATQHYAVADYGDTPRHLQRITVAGDVPVAPNGERSRVLYGDDEAYHATVCAGGAE